MTPKQKPTIPKPPKGLSKAASGLWRSILSDYELESHHLRLLEEALRQQDRAGDARALVEKEGLTVTDRFGQTKGHPAVEIERSASLAFLRILRELGLDVQAPETRGPRRGGTN